MEKILWGPEEYWLLTEDEKTHYRCGPGRGLLERIIPDKWYFGWPLVKPLVVTPACRIHDFCYRYGPNTIEWKKVSDRGFRNNMVRLIEYESNHYSRFLYPITRHRLNTAEIYYLFVDKFGGPAFWKNRNELTEIGKV